VRSDPDMLCAKKLCVRVHVFVCVCVRACVREAILISFAQERENKDDGSAFCSFTL